MADADDGADGGESDGETKQRAENSLFANVSASTLEIRNTQYVHLVKAANPSDHTSILTATLYPSTLRQHVCPPPLSLSLEIS